MPEITEDQLKEFNDAKAALDGLKTEKENLLKELEETKLEVLTPEYTKFLEDQEKNKKAADDEKNKKKEDLTKLSPDEIIKRAKDEIKAEQAAAEQEALKKTRDARAREVAEFAKIHEDFSKLRPIMYDLSTQDENASLTLQQLYDKAKSHISGLVEGELKKRRIGNERPGGDNKSFEKYKKMGADEVARETLNELKEELGPIPSA